MNLLIPFRSPGETYSGPHALQGLSKISTVRCAVVMSRSLKNATEVETLLNRIIKTHELCFIYKSWIGEPDFSDIERLSGELEKVRPDTVIAIGGGSLLDAVKAARVLYEHPEMTPSQLRRPFGIPPCSKSIFVAVPTTMGTGAEVSSSAVIKDGGRKNFIVSHELLPRIVVVDPSLVVGLPWTVRLTTIADALAHAVESYVSVFCQPQAMDYAVLALSLIAANWTAALEETMNEEQALTLQLAALYAGYAQNHCLVGAGHALAHASAEAGFDHGLANAFYLPAVITANTADEKAAQAYRKLVTRAGLSAGEGLETLIALSRAIRQAITGREWPGRLTEEQLQGALADPGGRGNPIPLSLGLFKRIEDMAHE